MELIRKAPSPLPAARDATERYRQIASRLIRAWQEETGRGPDKEWSHEDFVLWLQAEAIEKGWRPATWRVYRKALEAVDPSPQWRRMLHQIRTPQVAAGGRRRRKKSLDPEDFAKLVTWLRAPGRRWGRVTEIWLRAGALTGLRPTEWREATLVRQGEYPALRVRSAKTGSGNAQYRNEQPRPEVRTIPLQHLGEHEIHTIATQIAVVQEVEKQGIWRSYYDGCRKTLYEANRQLFPRRQETITLYSGRHAFAASAKEAGVPDRVGGMLMGNSPRTFRRIYGGKSRKKPG